MKIKIKQNLGPQCQAQHPDSSHVAFNVFPPQSEILSLPPLTRHCSSRRLLFHVLLQKTGPRIKLSGMSLFFSPPPPPPTSHATLGWGGRTLDEQRCIFLSWANVLDISV